jgi:hypothetical protein
MPNDPVLNDPVLDENQCFTVGPNEELCLLLKGHDGFHRDVFHEKIRWDDSGFYHSEEEDEQAE